MPRAMDFSDQAVNIADRAAKFGHAADHHYGRFLVQRSGIKLQLGYPDEALTDALHALPLLQWASMSGRSSSDLGRAYLAQGRALQAHGKLDEARAAFRSAAEHLDNALGPDNLEARASHQLAESSASK